MADTEFDVPGFVRNEGERSLFKVQRMLVPGGKLLFSDAHLSLSKKSGGLDGDEFVNWLRVNVFPGPGWGFYKEEDKPYFNKSTKKDTAPETPAPVKGKKTASGKIMKRKDPQTKQDKTNKITPVQIVEAEASSAKKLIEQCRDKTTLKKALSLSRNIAHRGEHMRLLMRRLEQVY